MSNLKKRREVFCVRLANHIGVTRDAEKYTDLPVNFRVFVSTLRDCDIIAPLMSEDRETKGMSVGEIAIKYGIPKSTAFANLNNYRPTSVNDEETNETNKQ